MRSRHWLSLVGLIASSVGSAQSIGNPNWPPPASLGRQDLANSAYWPSDPDFSGQWQWWGFTPTLVMGSPLVPTGEKQNGIGMGFDRAWQQHRPEEAGRLPRGEGIAKAFDPGFILAQRFFKGFP